MELNSEYLVLQEVYKNAAMGTEAIAQLLPMVKNARFRSDLQTQNQQYDTTRTQAEEQLKQLSQCPIELTKRENAMLWLCLHGKTLCNQETSHLAQLMIEGSNMGILSLTKVLNSCGNYQSDPAREESSGAAPQPQAGAAETLARNVIRMEEDNIDRLKAYLS